MTKSGGGRRRTGAGWVIVLAALAMPVSAEPEGELVFAVPEGWTDISPGADLKGVPELPPDVLAQARNGRHSFFAIELTGNEEFAENVNAVLLPAGVLTRVSERMLDGLTEGMAKALPEGTRLHVWERQIVSLDGVSVGQVVVDLHQADVIVRELIFVIPARRRGAILTFASTPEEFDHYRPLFEATAARTQGIYAEDRWRAVLRKLLKLDDGPRSTGRLIGMVVGFVIGFIAVPGGIVLFLYRISTRKS
jgi:hypothetical protein